MDFPHYYHDRPCKACTSAEEMLMWSKKIAKKKETESNQSGSGTNDQTTGSKDSNSSAQPSKRTDCPLSISFGIYLI